MGKIRWRREWLPTPVFLPREFPKNRSDWPTHLFPPGRPHAEHMFEQILGDGEGQGSLAPCSPWSHKESETIEPLNHSNNKATCHRPALTLKQSYQFCPCGWGETEGLNETYRNSVVFPKVGSARRDQRQHNQNHRNGQPPGQDGLEHCWLKAPEHECWGRAWATKGSRMLRRASSSFHLGAPPIGPVSHQGIRRLERSC